MTGEVIPFTTEQDKQIAINTDRITTIFKKLDQHCDGMQALSGKMDNLIGALKDADFACLKNCKDCRKEIDDKIAAVAVPVKNAEAVDSWIDRKITRYATLIGVVIAIVTSIWGASH